MKNKIIITVLTLMVIGLSGYIVYDKITEKNLKADEIKEENNDDTNLSDNKENDTTKPGELDELKVSMINAFKFTYTYYSNGNTYCGGYDYDDTLKSTNPAVSSHTASSKYNSYNDMINDLKKYMSDEVINKKTFIDKDTGYIEKNGKLYCGDFYKGGNVFTLDNVSIIESKQSDNIIYTTIETTQTYIDYTKKENYQVNFSKVNGNWVVSSYQIITN